MSERAKKQSEADAMAIGNIVLVLLDRRFAACSFA
jgi:hypothetical protein